MSHDDRTLHLLPTDPDRARERASEDRLADAPRAIQEWFDAQADQLDQDHRLRLFLSDLAPGDDGDHTSDEDLGDASPPPQIGAWLTATAMDPDVDARLLAFVDDLVPEQVAPVDAGAAPAAPTTTTTLPPSTYVPETLGDASSRQSRWLRPAVGAALLLAAASLALQVLPLDPQTARPSLQARAPVDAGATVTPAASPTATPAAAPAQPDVDVQSPTPAASPDPTPTLASNDAAPPAPAAAPPTATPADPAAMATDAPPDPDVPERAVVVVTVPADPPPPTSVELSPTLATAGDILATTSAWKGDVVPGLSLRLDRGFGHLEGTEAAPQLALADGASLRVDLDRDVVDPDFQTFTIHTLSATVEVIGTRYSVTTDDGRTLVSTRRGLVRVTCTDGRKRLVSAGQTAACEPHSDTRILAHMEAMDRPPAGDGAGLSPEDQAAVLRRLMRDSSPESFLATTQVMLDRAIADPGYRSALELVRIDAMCALAWAEPARSAARSLLDAGHQLEQDRVQQIADGGCLP